MKLVAEEVKVLPSIEIKEAKRRVINRLIPTINNSALDPIILFEEYFVEPPMEFTAKENKNIEVVNYLFDGGLDHKNQIENKYTTILEGELLRFTTGKGFIHSERPVNRSANHGVQIWFALPQEKLSMEPSFQICHEKDFHTEENNARYVRTLAGKKSPLKLQVDAEIKDVLLSKNSTAEFEIAEGHNGLIYVISGLNGDLFTSDAKIKPAQGLFFENFNKVKVESRNIAVRFLFVSVKPFNKPLPELNDVIIK